MAYLRRHRRCGGCDCRDAGTYTQDPYVTNELECTACDGDKPPCHYIVHFGCVVKCNGSTIVPTADFAMSPECPFRDSCIFTKGADSHCTKTGGATAPGVDHWSMDISASPVVLTYDDGTISFSYTATDTWDCYGPNTLALTSVGAYTTCVPLPDNICITPDLTSYESDCIPSVDELYDTEDDRIACCDPFCDTMIANIYVANECGLASPVQCSGNASVGGRTGVNSPSGPSRELCCNFDDIFNSHVIKVCTVLYCSGGTWYVDWYCQDLTAATAAVFCGTSTAVSQCCPLGLISTEEISLSCFSHPTVGSISRVGIHCCGTCLYKSIVDGGSPTGFAWQNNQSHNPTPCTATCGACPTVDAAFYADHGYPNLITDTLDVACAHT